MITFLLLAGGAILVAAAILLAFAANGRRRAGQSGQAVEEAQAKQTNEPKVSRSPGLN